MSKRDEIESGLAELTQAELAEFVLIGAALLRRAQKAEANPFFFIKVGDELLGYWKGPMANVMQEGITQIMHKHGGAQIEIDR